MKVNLVQPGNAYKIKETKPKTIFATDRDNTNNSTMLFANHLKWLSVNEISTLSKPLPVAGPRGIHGLPVSRSVPPRMDDREFNCSDLIRG